MKTILFPISMGMSVRNILRTDIFYYLKKYCNLIISTPYYKDVAFQKEFSDPHVKIIPLPKAGLFTGYFFLSSFFLELNYWGFWLEKRPETIKKYELRLLQERGLIKHRFWIYCAGLWNLVRKKSLVKTFVERIIFSSPEYNKLLKKYKVDEVCCVTHDMLSDIVWMVQAVKENIPVSVFVHSWDNLPSRGRFYRYPEILIVWNKIMREQAINLHGFNPDSIYVCGIPQYDEYLKKCSTSRLDFLKKRQVPELSKIITYTCVAERVMPDEPALIGDLIQIIESSVWGDCVLLLRLHPSERFDEYKKRYSDHPLVRISMPDFSFAATYMKGGVEDGRSEFIDIMANSDVVINLASTTTIDAIFFDTPVVNIAYNPLISSKQWNNAMDWYLSSHFKNIVAAKGTRLAKSKNELIQHVSAYLNNPKLDQDERKRICQEQCYKLDGQSGKRVAKVICDTAGVHNHL